MKKKLDFVDALLQHYDTFIKFPETEDETRRCIAEFNLETDFPQIVGVLDSGLIEITGPKEDKNAFYCRKGDPAIVLQGVVNARLKFINVATGFPGSLHDSRDL